jgi:hypothetical protein
MVEGPGWGRSYVVVRYVVAEAGMPIRIAAKAVECSEGEAVKK